MHHFKYHKKAMQVSEFSFYLAHSLLDVERFFFSPAMWHHLWRIRLHTNLVYE